MTPIEPTCRIEFGPSPHDTKIFVNGENIMPRLRCQALKVNAVADALDNGPTKITLQIVAPKFDCDVEIRKLAQALRDEADRLETLIA